MNKKPNMNTIKLCFLLVLFLTGAITNAQNITVKSPDSNITVTIGNSEKLTWSVTWKGRNIVESLCYGI